MLPLLQLKLHADSIRHLYHKCMKYSQLSQKTGLLTPQAAGDVSTFSV